VSTLPLIIYLLISKNSFLAKVDGTYFIYFCLSNFRALLNTVVENGLTGRIELNEEGDRIESQYEIVNIQNGQRKIVGNYRSNAVSVWMCVCVCICLFVCLFKRDAETIISVF